MLTGTHAPVHKRVRAHCTHHGHQARAPRPAQRGDHRQTHRPTDTRTLCRKGYDARWTGTCLRVAFIRQLPNFT